jgi:hypothetical protein
LLGGSNSRIIGAAANARISEYCQIDRDTFCEKARNAKSFTPDVISTVNLAKLRGS